MTENLQREKERLVDLLWTGLHRSGPVVGLRTRYPVRVSLAGEYSGCGVVWGAEGAVTRRQ